ncbi:pectate lyase [Paenibacillus hemerocallicola]|nr:pectate lyase [Paenibacillus hemerocallicola]
MAKHDGRKKSAVIGFVVLVALLSTILSVMRAASDDKGERAGCGDPCIPFILKAEAVGANKVEVTFSTELEPFVPDDLKLVAPTGTWKELDPKLNRYLNVNSVETKTNEKKQTVATLEIKEALNPDGTLVVAKNRDPKTIKLLTASYYTGVRAKDIALADSLLTWQLDRGGWYKNMGAAYARPWDGKESRTELKTKSGEEIGTIDNGATTNEMIFMAILYDETKDDRYKQSARKAIEFLLTMQVPAGGWPQVYPARGNYSDNVTYNDYAMTRVMEVLRIVADRSYPFDNDIIDDKVRSRVEQSLERGLDYILKSQIKVDGKLTAWGAQHDPITYEPVGGRPYEHPSISSAESVAVVQYLMAIPNPSKEVNDAVLGALNWLEMARVKEMKYDTKTPKGSDFVAAPNSSTWYRFYEIGTNLPIFSGRDGAIKRTLPEIEEERRNGYAWGGDWPLKLLQVVAATGYYENRVYIRTAGTDSKSGSGHSLEPGKLVKIEGK